MKQPQWGDKEMRATGSRTFNTSSRNTTPLPCYSNGTKEFKQGCSGESTLYVYVEYPSVYISYCI